MSNLSQFVPWGGGPALDGPTTIFTDAVKTYTITNYSAFSTYSVSVSAGSASVSGDTITVTAPSTVQTITLTVTVDGKAEDFSVSVVENLYIETPAATPSNFGDAFEGGFYAGMVWNQLIQSTSSTTIGTGSKTFNCPTLTTPVTYIGHQVEVRSRANPANKMVGTVTGSSVSGKTITVNVTSTSGSGTFTDWSIMSRYRLIVAPKSSGENTGITIKNANTALPTACQTLTEGWLATEAMKNADTSAVYPAAHWARGLSIGGFDDWFIPARDQLELCWRNLKPVTVNNNTTRAPGASFNYTADGSYGDVSPGINGINLNSAPQGAAYSAVDPGQTAAAAFRSGGAEAFAYGSEYYWTSSEYSTSHAWCQAWHSSSPGNQSFISKSGAYRLRAVRRSII